MKKTKHDNGYAFESDTAYVFFGNKRFSNSIDTLNTNNIIFGKQVHESDLMDVSDINFNGSCTLPFPSDGLYTNASLKKIGLYTADCIPCFILSQSKLFSLHLGWRGVQKKLFEKALDSISPGEKIDVFIGPHILKKSFEVGLEVIEKISETEKSPKENWSTPAALGKYLVSLKKILEIKALKYHASVHSIDLDTKTSTEFHSFRQSSGAQGRNISFAFLKN